MNHWFRMYDEVLDDPKVQRLSGDDFKAWVNLLALTSRNNGKLPAIDCIAFSLRETEDAVSTILSRLLDAGLIECRQGGPHGNHYAPHNWTKRQYKSDISTERVKRFRERSKAASEAPHETDPESETDSEKKEESKSPVGDRCFAFQGKIIRLRQSHFDEWKQSYPDLDLRAELQSRDDWLATQDEAARKKWFLSTSSYLRNRQQKVHSEKPKPMWRQLKERSERLARYGPAPSLNNVLDEPTERGAASNGGDAEREAPKSREELYAEVAAEMEAERAAKLAEKDGGNNG